MLKNAVKHLNIITKHKIKVFRLSIKAGIPWRGFLHDFSKYSPTEFIESVKYYQDGTKSPIPKCREIKGYSKAWLHHKGRNKHHHEYWYDYDAPDNTPIMPYKYAVEMVCDQLAAGMTYNGKNWTKETQINYWRDSEKKKKINNKISEFLEEVYIQVSVKGVDEVINKRNLKELYSKYCD